jgi:hypothetical protein
MIAWEELTSPRQIYVRRWDGSAWLEVGDGSASGGGISNTDGDSVSPRLSMDYNGVPTVIWNERTPIPERNERKIHVRRFDGTSWVEVGEGSAAGDGISGEGVTSALPLVATSPHGALHAAWIQQNAAIFYKRTVPVPPPATGGIIVSDNFPLFATPGSARTVEVRALNSGQSTWDISIPVTLQSPAGSDPLFPQDAFVLTRQPGEIFNVPIKTGEVGLFTALLVVPDHHRPATDTTHWRLHDPNLGFFGAEISREIHIVALPLEGSANGDALVDAADIVALTNHLNGGTQILDIQCFANADVTNDGMLDQLDLDSLVNLVLGR